MLHPYLYIFYSNILLIGFNRGASSVGMKGHHSKWIQYEIGTDRVAAIRVDSSRVACKLRSVARRYFYCPFAEYLYAGASILGSKIFLGGSADWADAATHDSRLPSVISTAWLRLIGDTSRTATFHFHCHWGIWYDLSESLLNFSLKSDCTWGINSDVERSTIPVESYYEKNTLIQSLIIDHSRMRQSAM